VEVAEVREHFPMLLPETAPFDSRKFASPSYFKTLTVYGRALV
jgi:hypothetical protein